MFYIGCQVSGLAAQSGLAEGFGIEIKLLKLFVRHLALCLRLAFRLLALSGP